VGNEFVIALYIMAVGLAFAGGTTYLYQWIAKQDASLRFDGDNVFSVAGYLAIMLHMGWRRDSAGGLHISQALLSAFIAFGWSFIVGLIFLWLYLGVMGS